MAATAERRADLDARRIAEAAENGAAAVFVVDTAGRCLAVNPAACELTGYSALELRSLPAGALNAHADEGDFHRIEAVRGRRREGTSHLLRRDGEVIAIRFAVLKTTVGDTPALLSICWPV